MTRRVRKKDNSLRARLRKRVWPLRFIIYSVILFYAVLNIANITFPVLNEPQLVPAPLNMELTYPPETSIPHGVFFKSADGAILTLAQVYTRQIYQENSQITISAAGTMGGKIAEDIRSIQVGFFGAKPENPTNLAGRPFAGVTLYTSDKPNSLYWNLNKASDGQFISLEKGLIGDNITFTFPTQGEYSPSMVIDFNNFTAPRYIDYPIYHIHVESAFSMQQYQYLKAGTAITLTVALVGILESKKLRKYLKCIKDNDDNDNDDDETNRNNPAPPPDMYH